MDIILKENFLKLLQYNRDVLKIESKLIIENMAIKFVKNIDLKLRETFAIICGVSQNGAVGLAVARLLKSEGKQVTVYIVENQAIHDEDFKYQKSIVKNLFIDIKYVETIEELEGFPLELQKVNTLIDALCSFENENNFQAPLEYVIEVMNKSRIFTISVDIPSGMDYDTGNSKIHYVDSDLVVTFHKMKNGLVKQNNSRLNKFKIVVENIGLIERGKYVRH